LTAPYLSVIRFSKFDYWMCYDIGDGTDEVNGGSDPTEN
jgi:hypothetical protein